jgi:hypothetical protein
MENETTYTFSPELLATVAQLLQLAILTGTDLYDHLQTLQMVVQDGKLHVSAEFKQKLAEEITRLTSQAESLATQQLSFGFKLDQSGN